MFGISSTTSLATKRRSPAEGKTKPLRIGRPALPAASRFCRTFLDRSFSSGETPNGRSDPMFGTAASGSLSGPTVGVESGMLRLGPRIVPVSELEPEPGAGIAPGVGRGARLGRVPVCEPPSRPAAKPVAAKTRSRPAASASGALRLRMHFQRVRRRATGSGVLAKSIGVPDPIEHQIAAFRRYFQCEPKCPDQRPRLSRPVPRSESRRSPAAGDR